LIFSKRGGVIMSIRDIVPGCNVVTLDDGNEGTVIDVDENLGKALIVYESGGERWCNVNCVVLK
jgi:hypothetical protein